MKREISKVLYISQEIFPYLPESEIATMTRFLPQAMQERGKETRTFMPKYGCVNERRNQLHEVIRLSGMNLIIDDTDHPLIIKVASIQSARLQIYFIDNEDFFQRKFTLRDENNNEYADNHERMIFYVRGVMETVKKLRWTPDVIHCCGFMTALAPIYIKKAYNEDPFFKHSKVVYSLHNDAFTKPFPAQFSDLMKVEGIENADTTLLNDKEVDYLTLSKFAIDYADGVIQSTPGIDAELTNYIEKNNVKFLPYVSEDEYADAYLNFYDSIM